jgi:N-acetylglucosaminyl-diphospho-decaprenol L-rhamnosyltransferase
VRVVTPGDNLGYGSAINAGVAAVPSRSEWVLVANPDLRWAPGSIDAMIAAGRDPEIGVVGPLILTPGGEVYPSARRLPSLRTGIGHALFAPVWPDNPWSRRYRADRDPQPRRRDAGWLSGSCLLIRRSAFEAVGGFDEKFFMYFEDVDLCARIGAAGWRIVYDPSASVTHAGGHSTSAHSARMIREHHRSAYRYLAAKYHAWYLWPLRAGLRVGLWARALIASR